jgi:hypothetical protein
MSGSSWDNPAVRGHPDSDFVAVSEQYELDYFIKTYLAAKGLADSPRNRQVVMGAIRSYPGRAPIRRVDLKAWLDRQVLRFM